MSYWLVEDLQQKAISVSQACRVLYVSRRVRNTLGIQGVTIGRHRLRSLAEALQFRTANKQRFVNISAPGIECRAAPPDPVKTPPFMSSILTNFSRATHK